MSDEKSVLERLAAAAVSSDLSHRSALCDVDWEHGLGKAGVRAPVGAALLSLDLTLSSRNVPGAMRATMSLVSDLATKRGWAMTPMKRRKIAQQVLRHYLEPACPACKGRGMLGVERDKPDEYRPRHCHVCDGTGKRALPAQHGREVREVLYVMDARRQQAERQIRSAMGVRASID